MPRLPVPGVQHPPDRVSRHSPAAPRGHGPARCRRASAVSPRRWMRPPRPAAGRRFAPGPTAEPVPPRRYARSYTAAADPVSCAATPRVIGGYGWDRSRRSGTTRHVQPRERRGEPDARRCHSRETWPGMIGSSSDERHRRRLDGIARMNALRRSSSRGAKRRRAFRGNPYSGLRHASARGNRAAIRRRQGQRNWPVGTRAELRFTHPKDIPEGHSSVRAERRAIAGRGRAVFRRTDRAAAWRRTTPCPAPPCGAVCTRAMCRARAEPTRGARPSGAVRPIADRFAC